MVEFGNLLIEVKLLDDVNDILAEVVQITAEVIGDVLGIAQQPLEGEGRGVVEVITRGSGKEAFPDHQPALIAGLVHLQHRLLGGGQRVAETLDDAHGQDDVAILMGLVGAHQFVGNRPDEVRFLLYVDGCPFLQFFG